MPNIDQWGRPVEYQQITDGVTYTSSYQHNLSGALIEETYPSGRVVKNTFDSNGDVARVFGKATPSSVEKTYANSFNYTASGGISAMKLGNGKWETAKFNKRLQVTELGLGHASQDASLWKVNYEFGEYDSNNGLVDTSKNTGNIAKQTVSFNGLAQPFVQTYEYDSLYRLKQAKEEVNGQTDPNWSQSFTYDRYGNRLTHVKEINGSPITHNQQTHPSIDASTNRFSDTSQYGYDKAGNLIADADGRTFTFDGNNKQILVTGSNGTVGEYFYDGDGMRVKKHVYTNGNHNKTIIFVYSGGKLAEEYSTEAVTSPKIKYLTEDHLGTPRIITNGTGEVVSRRDFMPFGQEIAKTTGTRSDSSYKYSSNEDNVKQKFTGYQQDSETMLDFAEARMYENRHARFTAVDPLMASGKSSNPQTFNRYAYVMNRPFTHVDKDGKYPTEIHNDLIDEAFINLSSEQKEFIKWGSASVDTRGGSGRIFIKGPFSKSSIPMQLRPLSSYPAIDLPTTLIPSNAAKHAMIPEGKTKEKAIKEADDFVETNMQVALSSQNKVDRGGKVISLAALYSFGRAQHTMMDSISPAHRIYQPYNLEVTGSNPFTFGISVFRDVMGLMDHGARESKITDVDKADAIMSMRAHLLTVFGVNMFNQAVPEDQRQAVIDYVNKRGFSYNQIGGMTPNSWSLVRRATNLGGEATADPPATNLDEHERRKFGLPLPEPTP